MAGCAVASSGIAATLLIGGRTAHSLFRIPLDLDKSEAPTCNISRGSAQAQLIMACKVIVWDEVTMTHKKALECVDRSLQDILQVDRPFGGKLLVMSGDFRQTLPIDRNGNRSETVDASVLWSKVTVFELIFD
jgi:hypothetical protein